MILNDSSENNINNESKYKLREVLSFYEKRGEVIGSEDLSHLDSEINVYTGFEISGAPHIGTYTALKRVCSFENLADYKTKTIILLADFHSFINKKDIIKNSQIILDFVNFYKNQYTKVINGFLENSYNEEGHQQKQQYWEIVFKILNRVSKKRLIRALTLSSKVETYKPLESELLYVVLQVADMIVLNIDIAIGGTDQRKIHMLYSDLRTKYLKKENLRKIIFIHHDLCKDCKGVKISKSKENYLPLEEILEKRNLMKDLEMSTNEKEQEILKGLKYLYENIFNFK